MKNTNNGEDSTQVTGLMSITDVEGQKYMLFPNPNDGNFILQQAVADNEPIVVEIWDAVGRSIYKERLQFAEATSRLQIKSLATGLYLLQLTDSKSRMYKFKFVVE